MKDRSFEYPCILDPMRSCPTECKLYMSSVKVLLMVADKNKETPEAALSMLRSGSREEIETFRRINASALIKSDKIAGCSHYPNALEGITDSLGEGKD